MNKRFIEKNYHQLLALLNCLKVGVYITDGDGTTLLVNDESCETGGLTREDVTGKNMRLLEQEGFVKESATLRTLASKKEESLIQNLGDGGKIFITGTPLFHGDQIELVVCTERDITETLKLKELLKNHGADAEKCIQEINYLRTQHIEMWGDLVAKDDQSKKIAEKAYRVAKLDTTILLTGESGTGKEVYANFIYKNSKREGKPFIKVNCAAIPDHLLESEMFGYEAGAFTGADKNGKMGLFEMANHGTLFLDEIGDIPVHLQPKLLRVLQEKEIIRVGGQKVIKLNLRVIAATNRDLPKEIERGNFREDLYYRINIMPIELMPLRGRKKDIRALTLQFIKRFSIEYKIDKQMEEAAIKVLQKYQWPGNIRELENVIERLMISFDGEMITMFQVNKVLAIESVKPLKQMNLEGKTLTELVEAYECKILEAMLAEKEYHADICKELSVNKSTLSRKLKKYNLG